MSTLGPADVKRWLDGHGLGLAAVMHEDLPRVHTVAEAAEALGVASAAIAKTVVFVHDGSPLAVLAPGDRKVRDRLVVAHIGGTRNGLRMARPDEVLEWTGYPVGGVPPVAHRGTIRLLMDQALLELDRVIFGGGSDAALLEVDPKALAALLDPEIGAFSEFVVG